MWNVLWEAFLSIPSLLKFSVVSINKIHRRCCRDCRRDRNFSISATLVAAVVLVATIAEECVSIYRHRRWNTFFDDSGDSSDGSDYMETGLYASDLDTVTLEISLNQDLNVLVAWFSQNYLIVNSIKTQGMVLGSHTHVPDFFIGETKVELANSLKIFGVTIDCKLTYCEHISNMLKKVYAKIDVLRRLKRLMPRNVSLSLYKAYLLGIRILQPTTYWNK